MLKPLLLSLLPVFAMPAMAMRFEIAGDRGAAEIVATGPIEPGDAQRLRAVVDRIPPATPISGLRISSPGGNVREAEVLASAVRVARLPVTVGQDSACASACFLIFAAAPQRRVGYGARIGVHSASIAGQDSEAAMAVTTEVARRANEYGVPPAIIGKLVVTGPKQITWLTPSDLMAMGAVPDR